MVATIAEQIGESPDKVKEMPVNWAQEMLKKGVIVDLHIGRTRFIRKMTKEDIGLDISDKEFEEFVSEYYDLGTKLLIPKRVLGKFSRIENRARTLLAKHSFNSPWGAFVPYTAYSTWKARNEELKSLYMAEKEELKSNIEHLKTEILDSYKVAAVKIYEKTGKQKPFDKFLADFLISIESQIPDVNGIEYSFHFSEDVYYIPLPSELEEEMLKVEQIKREEMLLNAETRAEEDKIRAEAQMHRDAVAKMLETKKQKVDGMLDSISAELRGAIYSTLRDALFSIKDRNALTGSSVKSMRVLIEKTRMLNFINDREIESALLKIEGIVNERSADRSLSEAATVFNEVARTFRQCALEGDDLPNIREFGLL